MKKLLFALLIVLAPITVCMESSLTQADLKATEDHFYKRFINRVKEGKPLIFINKTAIELSHGFYIACLYNQSGSALSIINFCKKKEMKLNTIYAQISLLLAQINQNNELIHLLNEHDVTEPVDIHKAIYLSVKQGDQEFFEKLISANFDCNNTFIVRALELAMKTQNSFAAQQLLKLGVKLENATPLKHPRIIEIQKHAANLQKLAKKS